MNLSQDNNALKGVQATTARGHRRRLADAWIGALCVPCALFSAACFLDLTPSKRLAQNLRTVAWIAPDTPPGPENMWTGIPKAYNGNVFVVRRNAVIAFGTADGHEVWRHAITRSHIFGPASFLTANGQAFVATDDSLLAFDAASGAVKWAVPTDHDYSQCEGSIDSQAVYLCSYDHHAAAFDLASGQQRWSVALSPTSHYSAPVFGSAVSGDTLYLTSRRDINPNGAMRVAEIFALQSVTGAELWRWTSATSDNSANGSPAVVGRLLVADDENGGAVFAIDRFTQAEQWRIPGAEGDAGPKGTPAVIGDTVYVASADGSVLEIHAPTGKVIWRTLSDGSYLSVGVCKNKVFANNFGLDVRDRRTGAIIDRVLASREDANYAYGGIGTDGIRIFVTSTIGTYAIAC